jgi:Tol biopolymer transport system component
VVGLYVVASASAQAPDEDWRVSDTEHFRVTYPHRLRTLAIRVADCAARARLGLVQQFDDAPPGTIDIVVTDHTDTSNGLATVAPWNRVTIFAPPPLEGFELAYFDDWLELVVTHELAHIFHLDRRGRLGSLTKAMFGRAPIRWPIFPNSALPSWAVEGLATYYESSLTDAGRVSGTFHEMALRTAVLEDAFETLPQMSGDTQVWPAGNRPYIYGSLFFDHLTRVYGQERMAEFARAVDGQLVPYRMNAAAQRSFGVSFTDAFEEWSDALATRYTSVVGELETRAPLTRGQPVATDGRWALNPALSPDGATLAFARSNGPSDAQIHLTDPSGAMPRTLTRANGLPQLDWTPDGRVVFSQIEFVDPYRSYKDLYVAGPGQGAVRRLTHGARVDFPSVSPDGDYAVAVQQGEGRTWIVRVDLATGDVSTIVEPTAGTQWAYPAVSPDGRWIAVSRWEPGAFYDLLVLDADGQTVERVTNDRAIDLAPTWTPDGRQVLWASDRTGIPNLFAAEIGDDGRATSLRQVSNLATGGSYPEVNPSATWIYFSVYHADGWHVERIPYDPSTWSSPAATDSRFTASSRIPGAQRPDFPMNAEASDRPYRPFPSLWPRFWIPTFGDGETRGGTQVLGPRIGISTGAIDTVERHAAGAALAYEPQGDRLSGGLGYAFTGLGRPILGVSATQRHTSAGFTVNEPADAAGPPLQRDLFLVTREQELRTSLTMIRRRVRSTATASVGVSYVWERQQLLNDTLAPETAVSLRRPTSGLPQLDASARYTNTRLRPFSISPEDGVSGVARARRRWDPTAATSLAGTPGTVGSWTDLSGDIRLFKSLGWWGFANHVVAVRASGGRAWGGGADAFFYSVGGTTGQAEAITGLTLLAGSARPFPIRGYRWSVRSGSTAWSASAEYRMPLARVNRGLGTVPLYLDWISGSLFVDAGNAWGAETSGTVLSRRRGAHLLSAGGELLLNGLPLWTSSTLLRLGLAVPLREGDGPTAYVRLGLPF